MGRVSSLILLNGSSFIISHNFKYSDSTSIIILPISIVWALSPYLHTLSLSQGNCLLNHNSSQPDLSFSSLFCCTPQATHLFNISCFKNKEVLLNTGTIIDFGWTCPIIFFNSLLSIVPTTSSSWQQWLGKSFIPSLVLFLFLFEIFSKKHYYFNLTHKNKMWP